MLSATAKVITPVFKPMGIENDNWPATVGIITGLLAKEVVVGTLDALYSRIDKPMANEAVTEVPFNLSASFKAAVLTIPDNLKSLADQRSINLVFRL